MPGRVLEAVVFDLDDTLLDTARLLLPAADRRAVAAVCAAGCGAGESEGLAVLRELREEGARDVFGELARRVGAPADAAGAARRAFFVYDVPPIALAPDVLRTLAVVGRTAPLALLTTGHGPTQRAKVAQLGIAERFAELVFVEMDARGGKTAALAALLARRGWAPGGVVSVGDRPSSDVRAANRNGCTAVRVRRPGGEFENEQGAGPEDRAWRTITSVTQLPDVLAAWCRRAD